MIRTFSLFLVGFLIGWAMTTRVCSSRPPVTIAPTVRYVPIDAHGECFTVIEGQAPVKVACHPLIGTIAPSTTARLLTR
jgi:hypothetical protein